MLVNDDLLVVASRGCLTNVIVIALLLVGQLLLMQLVLVVGHVVRLLRLLLLRMVVAGMVVIHGDSCARVQLRGAARVSYAFGNGGFHLTAGVDGGRLVAILGHVAHRPTTTPRRRVRSVAVYHAVLATIVGCIPDIHPVKGWEARVGHALRWLASGRRATVVGRRYALP